MLITVTSRTYLGLKRWEQTLKHDLIPPLLLDFPAIGVERAVSERPGKSPSSRYNFSKDTVRLPEVVLANVGYITAGHVH